MARQTTDGRNGRLNRNQSAGAAVLDHPAPHAQDIHSKALLRDEIMRLVDASHAGHLSERGRVDQFEGEDR